MARYGGGRIKTTGRTDGDGDGDTLTDGEEGEGKTIGFRTYGKSNDHRGDLPQIVVGMAVTRDGIPVRVWCWPGNTGDSKLIRQVRPTCGTGPWPASCGSVTAGSPARTTAGRCAR